MSTRGVFAVDRGVFGHEVFADEPFTQREAWIWLIGEAAWKPRTRNIGGKVVSLERGQLAASLRFMAERWGWEKDAVARFLVRLKKHDMIATDSATGLSVITICNYGEYQRVSLPDATYSETGTATGTRQERDKREDIKNNKIDLGASAPTPMKRGKPSTAIPENFALDDGMRRFAGDRGYAGVNVERMFERFSNHHRAKGSKFVDWPAAWRTWVGTQLSFDAQRNAPQQRRVPDV